MKVAQVKDRVVVSIGGLSSIGGTIPDGADEWIIEPPPEPDTSELVEVVPISGPTVDIDYDVAQWWDITLSEDCTFTISNPPDPLTVGELVVVIRQGIGAPFTVTWPASVQWDDGDGLPGGAAPTLNTAASAQDVITLVTFDGGVTWGGSTGGGGDDITEAAVQAVGHYEVMMDGGSPPAALESGSGTDWLYVWVYPTP